VSSPNVSIGVEGASLASYIVVLIVIAAGAAVARRRVAGCCGLSCCCCLSSLLALISPWRVAVTCRRVAMARRRVAVAHCYCCCTPLIIVGPNFLSLPSSRCCWPLLTVIAPRSGWGCIEGAYFVRKGLPVSFRSLFLPGVIRMAMVEAV